MRYHVYDVSGTHFIEGATLTNTFARRESPSVFEEVGIFRRIHSTPMGITLTVTMVAGYSPCSPNCFSLAVYGHSNFGVRNMALIFIAHHAYQSQRPHELRRLRYNEIQRPAESDRPDFAYDFLPNIGPIAVGILNKN